MISLTQQDAQQSKVAELMRLAIEFAHVYSFVGDDTMPIKKKELEDALTVALAQPEQEPREREMYQYQYVGPPGRIQIFEYLEEDRWVLCRTLLEKQQIEQFISDGSPYKMRVLRVSGPGSSAVEPQENGSVAGSIPAPDHPAPPAPPDCKTEAEKLAYAFGWWKALERVRARELTDAEIWSLWVTKQVGDAKTLNDDKSVLFAFARALLAARGGLQ